MNDGEILLQLDDVNAYYGASHVLQGVSLCVPRGGIVSLIGRNGAGKTTTLKSVVGLVQVSSRRDRVCRREHHRLAAASDCPPRNCSGAGGSSHLQQP